jgi:DNA-binding SARP family transcriptional activator
MVRISLFGSLTVALGDQDAPARALAGRCAGLLAYLALGHGRSFTRSELLANVWPERSSSASMGSFNTALWRLRGLVERPPLKPGDLITCDRRGAIGLNGPGALWLDVAEFERWVSPGLSKPVDRITDEDIDGLRRGVSLYTADILLDLSDDWALRERERHRRNYLNALGRLMQLATVRRQHEDGIRYAQAILDRDALREDVHRDLMRLYLASGQRAQALQQFEHCRDLLRRELAIQPMRETMALYQSIAQSAIAGASLGAAAPAGVPATHAAAPAAAGDDLRAWVEAARRHLAAADAQLAHGLASTTG